MNSAAGQGREDEAVGKGLLGGEADRRLRCGHLFSHVQVGVSY